MIDYTRVPSPCFVLEEARLRKNLELLARVQREAGVKIICALKGFSMWSTFPLVGQYLAGATASSLNETLLAASEMGKEVHVFAPVYGDDEIDEILSHACHITYNSVNQWKRFQAKTRAAGVSAGLRWPAGQRPGCAPTAPLPAPTARLLHAYCAVKPLLRMMRAQAAV